MDISVVAAVGSFAVSERILKPKATVLIILGCVLVYDLTTKTHDAASLRVYRGPALLAFTLMMSAYSLRIWRRNGVACDELLFLPGTPHGQQLDPDGGTSASADLEQGASGPVNEGDAAAGLSPSLMSRRRSQSEEMVPLRSMSTDITGRTTALSEPVVGEDSDEDAFHENWDDEGTSDSSSDETAGAAAAEDDNVAAGGGICRRTTTSTTRPSDNDDGALIDSQPTPTNLERFQENHPRIVRIGTFFFFRSSSNPTGQNATYAPSGPAVFGAALDLSMPILFNFHLFIEAYNHISTDPSSEMTAKILPLIFLTVLMVRSVIPPGKRKRFWSTIKFVALAPFHRVRFRDAFIGDVVTSMVRPLQDILFALSYYGLVVYGTVIGSYGLSEAGTKLEQSWFLHNVVLPCCALIPLWWKFLQTLRQAYDANRRWPYYGDSFKYLTAALVILYAMTHPEGSRSPWWLVSFLACVLYQIAWDTFVDWELFCIAPSQQQQEPWCFRCINSMQPRWSLLLTLHMNITQPLAELLRKIPTLDQIQLRSKRLYKTESFYYRCFVLNALLRFCWMLCFIPAYRFRTNHGEEEKETTFSSDVNSYVGVLLPVAELLRRCHWGFLKVEMETSRMMDHDILYSQVDHHLHLEEDAEEEEQFLMQDDASESKHQSSALIQIMPTWLDQKNSSNVSTGVAGGPSSLPPSAAATSCCYLSEGFLHKEFLTELVAWAVAFVGLGYYVTF